MTDPAPVHPVLSLAAERGVLFYGLTPPRAATEPQRRAEIAGRSLARLHAVAPDALVLYDVDSEQTREDADRPFPFTPMLDPVDYLRDELGDWQGPTVVYRAVGKYSPVELSGWFASADPRRHLTVLVGAASSDQPVRTSLREAYDLRARYGAGLCTGAVTIAERHQLKLDEHERMLAKQQAGCSFFVSQVCYDLDHTRDVLSDYAYACRERGTAPAPVVVTLSPCGSAKTLEFMAWLGIHVPRWLRNEILHAGDPLEVSYRYCVDAARTLVQFCRALGLPFGINVESVTNRKVEIEAAVDLAHEVRTLLHA